MRGRCAFGTKKKYFFLERALNAPLFEKNTMEETGASLLPLTPSVGRAGSAEKKFAVKLSCRIGCCQLQPMTALAECSKP